jgi:hypothetical protein
MPELMKYNAACHEATDAPWRNYPLNQWIENASQMPVVHSIPARKTGDDSTVYFMQVEPEGPIKIGIAVSVQSRLDSIQSASPYPISVIGIIPHGGIKLERELHRQFKDARLRGEWFWPTPELLLWIENHAKESIQ